MKVNRISFLEKAADFKSLGLINNKQMYFAYGVEWARHLNWVDKLNDCGSYEYYPQGTPNIPHVYETYNGWNNTGREGATSSYYLNGECLYEQTCEWTCSRGGERTKGYVDLKKADVELCTTKEQFLKLLKSQRAKAAKIKAQKEKEEIKQVAEQKAKRKAKYIANNLKTNLKKFGNIFN